MKFKKTKTTRKRKPIVCQINKVRSNKPKSKTKTIAKKYTLEEIKKSYLAVSRDIFSADKKLEDFEKKRRINPYGNKKLIKECGNILSISNPLSRPCI